MVGIVKVTTDILHNILGFLCDDGTSVVRLATTSRVLYNRILQDESDDGIHPNSTLWKNLLYNRWREITLCDSSSQQCSKSYKERYIERRSADAAAMALLQDMTGDLVKSLALENGDVSNIDDNASIGKLWDHPSLRLLLKDRVIHHWILKSVANKSLRQSYESRSTEEKLKGFLAAQSLQYCHLLTCMEEWDALKSMAMTSQESEEQQSPTAKHLFQGKLLEHFTLLICEIQKTPMELSEDLDENDSCRCEECEDEDDRLTSDSCDDDENSKNLPPWTTNMSHARRAAQKMNRIASVCRERILHGSSVMGTVDKMKTIVDVLTNSWYGFGGNSEDYYNYRNVLLDQLLETQSGMPLTLSLLYSCICRRLGIAVQIIGLPGHVVLGFETTTEEERRLGTARWSYLDVFHGGRILSVEDCQNIVAAYGIPWNDEYLSPLPLSDTLRRIFNNLRNCHDKVMGEFTANNQFRAQNQFCSELYFQASMLGIIERVPPQVSHALVERLEQRIPIVLSPDLLKAYHLLSRRGSDHVSNLPHVLLSRKIFSDSED